MRKKWFSLYIIGIIFVLLLSSRLFSIKEDYESVYYNNIENGYNIKILGFDNNKSNNIDDVLDKLGNFAKKNSINIYRSISSENSTTQYNRKIYAAVGNYDKFKKEFRIKNDNFLQNKTLLNIDIKNYNDSSVEIKQLSESGKEGLEGFYYIDTTGSNIEKINSYFETIGLVYEPMKKIQLKDALEYIENQFSIKPLLISILLFIFTFIFISLYEIFLRFKEIAITKMLGYTNKQIIGKLIFEKIIFSTILLVVNILLAACYNMIFHEGARLLEFLIFNLVIVLLYVSLILVIYIFLLLFIYIVEIPYMIKGKKNIKFIKPFNNIAIFIFTFVILVFSNGAVIENNLLKSLPKEDDYNNIKNYYSTKFLDYNGKSSFTKETNEKYKNLTNDLYDDVLLYSPSRYFYYYKSAFQNGLALPSIIVNDNYFTKVDKDIIDTNKLVNEKNIINIVLPKGYELENLKIDAVEIGFKTELDYKFNYIYYDKNEILIYMNNYKKYSKYKDKPIFITLTKNNLENLRDDVIWAYYSRGEVLLKSNNGYDGLLKPIIKNNLEKNIQNARNVYESYKQSIEELQLEIYIYIATCIVMFVIYINMLIFTTLTYLEENKKVIFIKKILGYKFLDKYGDYILSSTILICLPIICYNIFYKTAILTSLGIVIISYLVICIILSLNENKILNNKEV